MHGYVIHFQFPAFKSLNFNSLLSMNIEWEKPWKEKLKELKEPPCQYTAVNEYNNKML